MCVPYVENWREHFGEEKAAQMIMNNFKGQVTVRTSSLLEERMFTSC